MSLGPQRRDLAAALSVAVLAVPQGIAYAVLAGLPPAVGLYAAALPVALGSLARSSRFVVTGPTNALSLLVGHAIATTTDPVTAAAAIAALVGIFQLAAGALRVGVLVDYISMPVLRGYITGAGILIAVNQVPALTVSPVTVVLGLGTALAIVGVARARPDLPAELLVIGAATAVAVGADLQVRTIGDLGAVPFGIPWPDLPRLDAASWQALLPAAVAAAVLSTVEVSAVARTLAARSGDRLDLDRELAGQGVANVTASLVGALPVGGSLLRSAANHAAGARTRWAGILGGLLVLAVPLGLRGVVDAIPLAALAGLLLVVAFQLVAPRRAWRQLAPLDADAAAFGATALGALLLPLDRAIYLGVGLSLVLFLRRARHLVVTELSVDPDGRLREGGDLRCAAIRIVQVEGNLFFAAARALEDALHDAVHDPAVRVLIVRLKRTHGIDRTAAEVLGAAALRLRAQHRQLILVGLLPEHLDALRDAGADELLGETQLFPTQQRWFAAMHEAIDQALAEIPPEHGCDAGCCPLATRTGVRRAPTPTSEP